MMTKERKKEIFQNLIDYVFEHCSTEEEEKIAFKNIIGLSDAEMKELGIN